MAVKTHTKTGVGKRARYDGALGVRTSSGVVGLAQYPNKTRKRALNIQLDKAILEVAVRDMQALVPLMQKDRENYVGTPKYAEWQRRNKALNDAIKVAKRGI